MSGRETPGFTATADNQSTGRFFSAAQAQACANLFHDGFNAGRK